jgi:peptidoglycan/xylan/chitin deacetylase (PgdA/CDA1 family)
LLADEGFNVLPLTEIADALASKRPLPPKAVAITFDDGYRSVYDEAMPRLRARDWPFAIFVATDSIDGGAWPYLTWDHLREMSHLGATVLNHTSSHDHLLRRRLGESEAAWRRRVRDDIEAAQQRLDEELESSPKLFAYPYGEFTTELENIVAELGYVAFGQQSGPAGWTSGTEQLPRFPVAKAYADVDALRDKLYSRPIPLTVLEPDSRVLPGDPVRPELRLEIPNGPYRRDALRCYVAGQPPADVSRDGDIVTVRATKPLGAGRSKYNCTMPSATESGVYHWYSHLWIKPNSDGSWYAE